MILLAQVETPVSATGHGQVLLALLVVLLAAKLMAELFERLRQPAVVGEILAGVIIGPGLLNLVHPNEVIGALAEIGVIFALFTVGLETKPSDIFKVGGTATLAAILGVIVPFIAGWLLLSAWGGYSTVEATFLGAAMVATSVGITARVLSGMGLISLTTSRVILAAAVIDDVIGLLVLAVVSSMASGHINYLHLALIAFLAVSFTLITAVFGSSAVKRVKRPVDRMKINHSLFIFSLLLCFGLAVVADLIGIAGIIGAFLAGVALSEAIEDTPVHVQSQTLSEFLMPFFIVNIGLHLNVAVFASGKIILISLVAIVLACASKLIGCGLGAAKMGKRRAIQVGVGMIPRGEVGIVVAQIGLGMKAVGEAVYAVVLAIAVATTLIAPILIKAAFAGERPAFAGERPADTPAQGQES